MRCPDCNKFVSFDAETEPELDTSVDDEGVIRINARIVNTCQECGQELKEATLEIEIDLSEEATKHMEACHSGDSKEEPKWSVVDESGTRTERTQDKDRHGRPIKSSRYMKHFYGAEVSAGLQCDHCNETVAEGTGEDDVQGSGMDELV